MMGTTGTMVRWILGLGSVLYYVPLNLNAGRCAYRQLRLLIKLHNPWMRRSPQTRESLPEVVLKIEK
jgi:hypothetical protein